MSAGTVSKRSNHLTLRMLRFMGDTKGPVVIPNVKHKKGDYAELVDADGNPIAIGPSRNHDIEKWWVRCCRANGNLVWLMPFAVWRVFRDRAAEKAMVER